MLKTKYLHRSTYRHKDPYYHRYHRNKNIDIFSDLPKRESIRDGYYHWSDWTPLVEFVESKIGENWNDVYSEIVKKIKPNLRFQIENNMFMVYMNPIYDEDFIPRDNIGRILKDRVFIDMNNILRQKTMEELMLDSIRIKRKIKLQQILERIINEEEILIKNEMNE